MTYFTLLNGLLVVLPSINSEGAPDTSFETVSCRLDKRQHLLKVHQFGVLEIIGSFVGVDADLWWWHRDPTMWMSFYRCLRRWLFCYPSDKLT